MTVTTHNNTKGLARAFDVRTGKLLWTFNTIPRPGRVRQRHLGERLVGDQRQHRRVDADHRGRGSSASSICRSNRRPPTSTAASVPATICSARASSRRSQDRQAQVALPVRASSDLGPRHVVGAAAGRHHRRRQADQGRGRAEQAELSLRVRSRHRASRSGRSTRQPVPQGDVPGERYSPTQPIPTQAAGLRAHRTSKIPDDVIDFTPELRAKALENPEALSSTSTRHALQPADRRQRERPARRDRTIGNASGGTNWPGGGYRSGDATSSTRRPAIGVRSPGVDRRRRRRVSPTCPYHGRRRWAGVPVCARPPAPAAHADAPRPQARREPPPAAHGREREPFRGSTSQGLPIVKPPYGVLAAIDLDRGEIIWQVPHGDTPDAVRNHPTLKGMNIPKTGQNGSVGVAGHQDARDRWATRR